MQNTSFEKCIRFAGHDLIMTGDYNAMYPIIRAADSLDRQPEHMTDIFNLSSASNAIYSFKTENLTIQGEKHYLTELVRQLMTTHVVALMAEPTHNIIYQIRYAFDIDNLRSNSGKPEANDPDFAERYRVPNHKVGHCKIYEFIEHAMIVRGEAHELIDLAANLRLVESTGRELSGTLSDLVYHIEYAFDIDGIRKSDTEIPYDPDFADQYLVRLG